MPRNAHKLTITAAMVSGALLLGAGLGGCNRSQSAATLLTEAKTYQQKGDLKAAMIQLKNAAAKSPEDANVRLALAQLYNESGDAVSAEKEYRKAISLGATPAQAMPGLANAMLAQGQFKKLLTDTEAEAAKGDPALLVTRGTAFLATGEADKATQAFEAVLARKPADGAALIGMAELALSQKDLEGGKRYVTEATTKDASNPEVWMFSASVAAREGRNEDALAAYDKVLALKPAHRSAHIEKAYLEIGMGKFDLAKADLEAARKATPGSLIVTYTEALLDYTQGKNAVAMEAIQKVLRGAPEHMPSILLAGAIELNLGQLEQAEQNLKKYLEKFPDNLYARKLLASTQLRASHPTEAAATLAPALKTTTTDPQLLALAGESYMQVRDFNKATELFEKAAVLAPKAASLRTSLGLSKLGQGDKEKAVSDMEMATTLDPSNQQSGIALVRTALSLKQFDKALAAVEALEKAQPDNALVQNLKGGVHLARNDAAGARAAFEKSAKLQPSYFPAVANLAQLDLQEKKTADAKKRLEAFLVLDKKHIGAMTALAEIAASEGNMAQATSWLEKASSENPDVLEPGMRLAGHYLKQGEKAKALTLARKLQTASPTNPELVDLLGQAQVANNDAAGALESYSKLVNLVPKSAKAQMRLAGVHLLLKNETAAAEDIKHAMAAEPDSVAARMAMIDLLMRKGQAEQALAMAHAMQKESAAAALGHMVEGDILMGQKKAEAALKAYEQAFSLAKSPQMLIKLVQAQRASGKAKEADARIAQFLKEHPDDAAVNMINAESQLAAKQYKSAIASFESALKHAPNNVIALNNLAYAYQQEKDPRALATAEQASKLAPEAPAVLDTLGWILVEQGNVKRGVPVLEQAISRAPDSNDIRYHLAFGLHKAGDKARARKEIELALANGKPFSLADEARALLKQL